MNIFALLQRVWLEIQGFVEAADERVYLAERIGLYFDWIAERISIPGPDAWARTLILWIVDLLYTAYAKAEATPGPDEGERESFWAGAPLPPHVNELFPAGLAMPVGTETTETEVPPCTE